MAVLLAGVLSVPADAARGARGSGGGGWHGGRASVSGGNFSTSPAGGWGTARVSRGGSMVRVGGSRYLAPPRATQTWSARRAAAWPAPVAERRVEGVRTNWPRYRHGARRIADNRWNHGRRVRISGHRVGSPRVAYYGGGYVGYPYAYYETGQPYVSDYDYRGFGYAGYGDAYSYVYDAEAVAEPVAEGPVMNCIVAEPEAVAGSGAIIAVQIALRDRGFYKGEVDGISGPQTRSAVREFKQCAGLPVNSRLDGSLLNALNL